MADSKAPYVFLAIAIVNTVEPLLLLPFSIYYYGHRDNFMLYFWVSLTATTVSLLPSIWVWVFAEALNLREPRHVREYYAGCMVLKWTWFTSYWIVPAF